jgi:fluoroacetyl-CoA thioesterase
VTITARVIHAEGRTVSFQVEARDEHEVITRGVHQRGVIRTGSFAKHVAGKSKA